MASTRRPATRSSAAVLSRARGPWVVCCLLCVGLARGGLLAQEPPPVAELDRVTLKTGRTLAGLITEEEPDHVVLKMKLGRGFLTFTLLRDEVAGIQRASEAGRALTEAEWKKLEAALARRERPSSPQVTQPNPPKPPPQQPVTPKDPRDILLAEARRLGLSIPPETSTEELQRLVEAEQARRHLEAAGLLDQALSAFSEASAELPTLAYYYGSGRSPKLVYRRRPLQQSLRYYQEAYKLLGQTCELDPALTLKAQQYRINVRLAVRQLELLVREADLVEEEGGSRKTNPDRR